MSGDDLLWDVRRRFTDDPEAAGAWWCSRRERGDPRAGGDRMQVACACGAVGRVLPPDFGYERDVRTQLVQWSGGETGAGRAAIEEMEESPSSCPTCAGPV